jgi:hypothetical protein
MATLRERLTVLINEEGPSIDTLGNADELVDAIIEVVADWLRDDEIRRVVYDGMIEVGPMLGNIGVALAAEARTGSSEGENDG